MKKSTKEAFPVNIKHNQAAHKIIRESKEVMGSKSFLTSFMFSRIQFRSRK